MTNCPIKPFHFSTLKLKGLFYSTNVEFLIVVGSIVMFARRDEDDVS